MKLLLRTPNSPLRTPKRSWRAGQATLEMMVSFVCAFLLLLLCIKLFLWFAERFVTRQKNYETTRVQATDAISAGSKWNEPSDRLRFFPDSP